MTSEEWCAIIIEVLRQMFGRKKILKKIQKNSKKHLTIENGCDIISKSPQDDSTHGSIAQLGEHLPYKQRVIGSSPIVSTSDGASVAFGLVVQLVRTLACHARGQGFESPSGRHLPL